jgi:hypothetical protein
MPNSFLLCERCLGTVVIKREKYFAHLHKVHNIILDTSFNIEEKIEKDREPIRLLKMKLEADRKARLLTQEARDLKRMELRKLNEKNAAIYREERKRLKEEQEKIQRDKREEKIKANSVFYRFFWDDFDFDKDLIRIKPNTHKQIFAPIIVKGSLKILNTIKDEYFKRLFNKPIKLYFF